MMEEAIARASDYDTPFDIVVVASSLGGPAALTELLSLLPEEFPVPILVVQHRSATSKSYLAELLNRRSTLTVLDAEDGETPRPGRVYLAPVDRHLRVASDRTLVVSGGARVQWTRPSADVLFHSVARHYGARAVGVVLTGLQRDGADGARAIKQRGGRVIVQEPASARAAGMPSAAIAGGCVDFAFSVPGIAQALIALTMVPGAAPFLTVTPETSSNLATWLAPTSIRPWGAG